MALELAEEIVAVKQHLRELEQRFYALVPDGPVSLVPTKAGTSLTERIIDLLDLSPSSDFDVEGIAKEVGPVKIETLRSTLARLVSNNRISKVHAGVYRSARSQELKTA